MTTKDLSMMTDAEIKAELKRRRDEDPQFHIEKGKKEGVVSVWPSTRSKFPMAAQATTWLNIVEHIDEIRDYCNNFLGQDSSSSKKSSVKKNTKSPKNGKKKKKKKKECPHFGQFDKDSGACEYCKQAEACQDETEGG